tara:strand:- start:127 stop:435 length:309 start_codon:yes stop_codon:yes gene_type:complete
MKKDNWHIQKGNLFGDLRKALEWMHYRSSPQARTCVVEKVGTVPKTVDGYIDGDEYPYRVEIRVCDKVVYADDFETRADAYDFKRWFTAWNKRAKEAPKSRL